MKWEEKEIGDNMSKQENFEKEMEELKEQIDNAPKEETPLDEHIQQMAYLWDKVHEKLRKDNICFHTKKPLIAEGSNSIITVLVTSIT